MPDATRTLMVCSCEDTMPLDPGALARGCQSGDIRTARHLCRTQTELFTRALGDSAHITVGCTQEAPLFEEIAADLDYAGEITFANIRETAGWAREAKAAGPKMAALLAAAAEPMPPVSFTTLTSKGVALVYGRDEIALSVGQRLAEHLDVTILLSRPGDITPPRVDETPVLKGTIASATGWLGAFELRINDYAAPAPSSRAKLVFGEPRNGATSHCDIVIDVSGGTPLFPAGELRAGYLRADPASPAAIEKLIAEAGHLVGEFDKPTYVRLNEDLCAHSRSQKTGCTRCLELCPTGAITPHGDHVAISAEICAGCGACAAVCPTGAVTYALPPTDALLRRLRTLLATYAEAGGRDPVVLLHDGEHGEALIDALARFGDGLPARVLPLRINEITQIGLETFAAALSFGAASVQVLGRARPKHDLSGLQRNLAYANTLAAALGFGQRHLGAGHFSLQRRHIGALCQYCSPGRLQIRHCLVDTQRKRFGINAGDDIALFHHRVVIDENFLDLPGDLRPDLHRHHRIQRTGRRDCSHQIAALDVGETKRRLRRPAAEIPVRSAGKTQYHSHPCNQRYFFVQDLFSTKRKM